MFDSLKRLKSTVPKKVIVCLNNLSEENFWKYIAAFVIFPTSIVVLFEIHQWFKVHFLNELRDSFKEIKTLQLYHNKKKIVVTPSPPEFCYSLLQLLLKRFFSISSLSNLPLFSCFDPLTFDAVAISKNWLLQTLRTLMILFYND